jgi:hypothetical protein
MKPTSTINRVPVTAFSVWAGKPETDAEMAAPLLTDPIKQRARSGSHECGWKPGKSVVVTGADDSCCLDDIQFPMSSISAMSGLELAAEQGTGGQPPDPRDLARWYQSRGPLGRSETGCRAGHPASVLVPGSALGLLPSIALSSAQANPIVPKCGCTAQGGAAGAVAPEPAKSGLTKLTFSWKTLRARRGRGENADSQRVTANAS